MCTHWPPCPPADRPDHDAAVIVSAHPEQGWNLLCNGTIVFDETKIGLKLPQLLPRGLRITGAPTWGEAISVR
ncbi:DUF5999 family protein [Streptomyces sp. TP-A0356]|uniref:DUF5999 family protein n=1 Tax=Streptomyces sp. TP-A0356 TaxID=1359208 RepID=UPI0006E42715|nr:DUF5999 family protein [Streptomyces sp. TP-A0356]